MRVCASVFQWIFAPILKPIKLLYENLWISFDLTIGIIIIINTIIWAYGLKLSLSHSQHYDTIGWSVGRLDKRQNRTIWCAVWKMLCKHCTRRERESARAHTAIDWGSIVKWWLLTKTKRWKFRGKISKPAVFVRARACDFVWVWKSKME